MTSRMVGRLAPSPTGAQHVGNARTYLLAWLAVRAAGGRVILRIEDLDSPRVKRGAIQEAIDDLHWLGLDWDEGPVRGGPQAPYVQSERAGVYREAWEELKRRELVYPCVCSRKDVAAAASAPHLEHEGSIYPGTCAHRCVADAISIAPRPYSWRFRTTATRRTVEDLVAGERACTTRNELGDFVIASAQEVPAYQLAVVIDDHRMGITQVLRGDDLIPSMFRQMELYDVFGWTPPSFAHVPLVVGPDGHRLAKRHGDTRLRTLRGQGVSAETLIGLLAKSCGLRDTAEATSARTLVMGFDLAKIPRAPFVFRPEELASQ